MEICEPVAITRLPRPAQNGGQLQFGSVWGLHNQTKKRRHEICTAIDGDSINIHEIQNGRTIFSHAIPPTATFACAPTSVRWKQDKQTLRQTYFAIRHDAFQLRSVLTREGSVQKEQEIKSLVLQSSHPLLKLDIVPYGQAHYLLAIQADGTITVATADLQHASTAQIPLPQGPTKGSLVAASILTPTTARKTVLKARQDISRDLSDQSAILATIVKAPQKGPSQSSGEGLRYGVWSVPLPPQPLQIEPLFSHSLPLNNLEASKKQSDPVPSFDPRTSTVILTSSNDIQQFDLTGLVPRKLPDMRADLFGHQDILLLPSSLALAAFPDSFRLLDPEFGTVRASLDLNQTLLRKKRKRSGSEAPGAAIAFVCFFPQLQRVMIYSRSHLIACDLKLVQHLEEDTNARLLVNSIGRGRGTHHQNISLELAIGRRPISSANTEEWINFQDSLTKMHRAGDTVGFETLALKCLERRDGSDQTPDQGSHFSGTKLSQAQKDFFLLKLFSMKSVEGDRDSRTQLCLNMATPQLIRRLQQAGVLSRQRLERALNSARDLTKIAIGVGDIAQSLLRADPSCEVLSGYLEAGGEVDCQEQAAVVRFLLNRILNRSTTAPQRLIMEAQDTMDTETDVADSKAVTHAMGPDEEKLLTTMLTRAVAGLGLLDMKSISSVLRTSFSGEEILGLVQLLRQQLFRTSHPGSVLQPQEQGANVTIEDIGLEGNFSSSSAQLRIDAILKILSGCIDAIGPMALLRRKESDDFLESVIPDLMSEVSLATQAAEECLSIHGTLRETLRFCQSDKSCGKGGRPLEATAVQRPGEIITLYSEEMEDAEASGRVGLLPLSLQGDNVVSRMKVRKGGGQKSKRSLRNRLMQERKQKGVYSFERLVL